MKPVTTDGDFCKNEKLGMVGEETSHVLPQETEDKTLNPSHA